MESFSNPDRREDDRKARRGNTEEVRSVILHPSSARDTKFRKLVKILSDWVNSVTSVDKLIVRDYVEDLYDARIIICLLEKLSGETITHHEVAISHVSIKENIQSMLDFVKRKYHIGGEDDDRWSADAFLIKDPCAILHVLIALAHHFTIEEELPSNITVAAIHRVQDGQTIQNKTIMHNLTCNEDVWASEASLSQFDINGISLKTAAAPHVPDVFDSLFAAGPEKLAQAKHLLTAFVSEHLSPYSITVHDIGVQFSDGVFLIILIGSLGGFFVPMNHFHITPTTRKDKIRNVIIALELMKRLECPLNNVYDPTLIVEKDLPSTFRVLYALFSKFKRT